MMRPSARNTGKWLFSPTGESGIAVPDVSEAMSSTRALSPSEKATRVPSGRTQLSFWYRVVCTDSVTYDWATATLRDNTAGVTTTVLPRTCSNNGSWAQRTTSVTASHSYTLTLIDHDDNWPGDPTYTLYDDVTVQ